MKILFIKATPKDETDSYTMKAAHAFLDSYKKVNPAHKITYLDLYRENIQYLDRELLHDLYNNPQSDILNYARQFAQADRFIIAAPMWNLGFPAILKAYIEYISVPGITFSITAGRPVGLLEGKGKKAVHITARGGIYSSGPAAEFEMGDRYLRTLLRFLGIDHFETLEIEGTNHFTGHELEARIEDALTKAGRMAENF